MRKELLKALVFKGIARARVTETYIAVECQPEEAERACEYLAQYGSVTCNVISGVAHIIVRFLSG